MTAKSGASQFATNTFFRIRSSTWGAIWALHILCRINRQQSAHHLSLDLIQNASLVGFYFEERKIGTSLNGLSLVSIIAMLFCM